MKTVARVSVQTDQTVDTVIVSDVLPGWLLRRVKQYCRASNRHDWVDPDFVTRPAMAGVMRTVEAVLSEHGWRIDKVGMTSQGHLFTVAAVEGCGQTVEVPR